MPFKKLKGHLETRLAECKGWTWKLFAKFEIFTVVKIQVEVWVVMPCSVVVGYLLLRELQGII